MNHELLVVGNIAKDIIFGKERFGGSAAAIAINASGLGISTGLLSVIGKDVFSQKYKDYLKKCGISLNLVTAGLSKLPECVVTPGENNHTIAVWYDNNSHKTMDSMAFDIQKVLAYTVVHLVSCPPGLSRRLASIGIKNLSYEPGLYLLSDQAYLDFLVMKQSKFIFFNEEEYQAALMASGHRSPRDFVASSRRILIVTQGEKGSDVYLDSDGDLYKEHIEAVKPNQEIIDYTGAGDCYKAGFLAGYIRGRSLRDCGILGSLMGAVCVIQEGGILPHEIISEIKTTTKI